MGRLLARGAGMIAARSVLGAVLAPLYGSFGGYSHYTVRSRGFGTQTAGASFDPNGSIGVTKTSPISYPDGYGNSPVDATDTTRLWLIGATQTGGRGWFVRWLTNSTSAGVGATKTPPDPLLYPENVFVPYSGQFEFRAQQTVAGFQSHQWGVTLQLSKDGVNVFQQEIVYLWAQAD